MDQILETAVIKDERIGHAESTVGGIAHSGLSHGIEEVGGDVVKGLVQEDLAGAGRDSPAGRARACPETPRKLGQTCASVTSQRYGTSLNLYIWHCSVLVRAMEQESIQGIYAHVGETK